MNNTYRKGRSYESICINKIELGIASIENGNRSGDEVGADLDYFFNKLEELNKPMYEDLYVKYCNVRLKAENNKELHS
jgi:hypothetical protein